MKKTGIVLLCLALALAFPFGIRAEGVSWYVVRAKDHTQPKAEPHMQYISDFDGFYVDKKHGDGQEDRVLYLTFDAGYENGNVSKILDILREEEVGAAFFILGHLIKSAPELVCRMENEGHLVCNHTVRHKDMSRVSDDEFRAEIGGLADMYQELTGKPMAKFFRPPEGRFNENTLRSAKACGYKTVFWSLTYADWNDACAPSPEKAKAILRDNTHNGAIILLHPMSNINVKILKEMISYWKAEGYRFGSLTEL